MGDLFLSSGLGLQCGQARLGLVCCLNKILVTLYFTSGHRHSPVVLSMLLLAMIILYFWAQVTNYWNLIIIKRCHNVIVQQELVFLLTLI